MTVNIPTSDLRTRPHVAWWRHPGSAAPLSEPERGHEEASGDGDVDMKLEEYSIGSSSDGIQEHKAETPRERFQRRGASCSGQLTEQQILEAMENLDLAQSSHNRQANDDKASVLLHDPYAAQDSVESEHALGLVPGQNDYRFDGCSFDVVRSN